MIPYPADDAYSDPFHCADSFLDLCDWMGVCPLCGDALADCRCDTDTDTDTEAPCPT